VNPEHAVPRRIAAHARRDVPRRPGNPFQPTRTAARPRRSAASAISRHAGHLDHTAAPQADRGADAIAPINSARPSGEMCRSSVIAIVATSATAIRKSQGVAPPGCSCFNSPAMQMNRQRRDDVGRGSGGLDRNMDFAPISMAGSAAGEMASMRPFTEATERLMLARGCRAEITMIARSAWADLKQRTGPDVPEIAWSPTSAGVQRVVHVPDDVVADYDRQREAPSDVPAARPVRLRPQPNSKARRRAPARPAPGPTSAVCGGFLTGAAAGATPVRRRRVQVVGASGFTVAGDGNRPLYGSAKSRMTAHLSRGHQFQQIHHVRAVQLRRLADRRPARSVSR